MQCECSAADLDAELGFIYFQLQEQPEYVSPKPERLKGAMLIEKGQCIVAIV